MPLQVASTKPSFDMAVVLDLLEAFLEEPDVLLDGSRAPPQLGSRKKSFDTSRVRPCLLIVLEELLFMCFCRSLLDGSALPPDAAASRPACDLSNGGSLWLLLMLELLRICFLGVSEFLVEASVGPPLVASAMASTDLSRARSWLFLVFKLFLVCFREELDFFVDASGQPWCQEVVSKPSHDVFRVVRSCSLTELELLFILRSNFLVDASSVENLQSPEFVASASDALVLEIAGVFFEDSELELLFTLVFLGFCITPSCQEVDGRLLAWSAIPSATSITTTPLGNEGVFVEVFQPLDPHSLSLRSFDTLNKVGIDCDCLQCADFDCSPITQAGVADILFQKKTKK